MDKIYTSAIIGCGSRGWLFGLRMRELPEKYKVVAVCDIDDTVRENVKKEWNLSDDSVFADENDFFKEKRADVLVIATQDRDHVRMCIRAMELGYDILMEKPISPVREEIDALLAANKKYNRKIVVCHVLRYAPAYIKIREVINSGDIGNLVHIENIEQVDYWHHAHSFVRGNWRNEGLSSPMIMQKSCHDFDMLQYLIGSRCKTVYSTGRTAFFKKQNQPEGAADRCKDCKFIKTCPYSAERIYIERWKAENCPQWEWPYNVVSLKMPNTEDNIRTAYEKGQYGRCVFACDNDVVDNQQVVMTFENGVIACHTMSAFTDRMGRRMKIHGTLGEIELLEDIDTLNIYRFGKEKESIRVSSLRKDTDSMAHGGGDSRIVKTFYDVLEDKSQGSTTLEKSVESHLMAFAAEKSRHTDTIVKVHEK